MRVQNTAKPPGMHVQKPEACYLLDVMREFYKNGASKSMIQLAHVCMDDKKLYGRVQNGVARELQLSVVVKIPVIQD